MNQSGFHGSCHSRRFTLLLFFPTFCVSKKLRNPTDLRNLRRNQRVQGVLPMRCKRISMKQWVTTSNGLSFLAPAKRGKIPSRNLRGIPPAISCRIMKHHCPLIRPYQGLIFWGVHWGGFPLDCHDTCNQVG